MWPCLRGIENKMSSNPEYKGRLLSECEINQIVTSEGFKDRSISPGGYDGPFHPEGLIVLVAEQEIAMGRIKSSKEPIRCIGTGQITGYGNRRYDADGFLRIQNSLGNTPPRFFRSFEAFRTYKGISSNRVISPKTLNSWHDSSDEFITTIKTEMVVGIYFSKSQNPYESIVSGIYHARSIQRIWREKTGISLPIYEYKSHYFEAL